jgi:hypothetical protein
MIQRRINHPLWGLPLPEAQPSGDDILEIRQKGRSGDLYVPIRTFGEPFI